MGRQRAIAGIVPEGVKVGNVDAHENNRAIYRRLNSETRRAKKCAAYKARQTAKHAALRKVGAAY